MSSIRCPGCGAKNPEGAVKCRLCAYDLRGQAELPMSQPKPGSAEVRGSSLKGVMALAVLGVVAIVLAGVLLGALPGAGAIATIRNKIPLIAAETSDGWDQFTEASARFRATMPVDRTQQQQPSQWSTTGTLDEWVSTLGPEADPDTTLSVQWMTVPTPEGEKVDAALTSLAVGWADSMGGRLTHVENTSFQGYPALLIEMDKLKNAKGDPITIRAVLIRQRDQLFILESKSVYTDHPQFDRLVNGFALL